MSTALFDLEEGVGAAAMSSFVNSTVVSTILVLLAVVVPSLLPSALESDAVSGRISMVRILSFVGRSREEEREVRRMM